MQNRHLDDLSALRMACVASRREAAARGATSPDAGAEIIRLQALIEALDRALLDETLLHEGEIKRARQSRQLTGAA